MTWTMTTMYKYKNGGLIPSSSLRHWTHSQQAQQAKQEEEESSLVEEILSDEDKSKVLDGGESCLHGKSASICLQRI